MTKTQRDQLHAFVQRIKEATAGGPANVYVTTEDKQALSALLRDGISMLDVLTWILDNPGAHPMNVRHVVSDALTAMGAEVVPMKSAESFPGLGRHIR